MRSFLLRTLRYAVAIIMRDMPEARNIVVASAARRKVSSTMKKGGDERAPSQSRCTLLALLEMTSGASMTRSFVVDDNQPGIVLDAGIAL